MSPGPGRRINFQTTPKSVSKREGQTGSRTHPTSMSATVLLIRCVVALPDGAVEEFGVAGQ